ncbi:hypothetical protein M7I_2483 [Glarea lozoyensis 74030]|uniref:Uncharacterized protein n=1 Tax=Glarea lozoyensis (strain ATCC 74030 / MF5533) TaxID=1104152 RepID=H0EIW5_GLAL7|nr:hypothetical protein M7I_2483 [Glarea lozoyensis 74030]
MARWRRAGSMESMEASLGPMEQLLHPRPKEGGNKQLDIGAPLRVHDYYLGDDPPPAGRGKKWVRGHFFNVPPEVKSLRKELVQKQELRERYWELVDNLKELDAITGQKKQRIIMADGVEHVEDETLDIWWSNTGHDEAGNSAGLVALKSRAEYDGDGIEDKIANTVWRPGRVWAEGTDDVMEFDDWWNEVKRAKTKGSNLAGSDSVRVAGKLEVDGGVDCGGGPFPRDERILEIGLSLIYEQCLRYMYKYLRTKDYRYIRRKIWDGVTGTIFNIPMLNHTDEAQDHHTNRMALIHPSAPVKQFQRNIFPLRIHCLPLLTALEPPAVTKSNEELVNISYNNPKRIYRVMDEDDPWYVTPEQEYLRDVPPRSYPLPGHEDSEILPYDDLHYLEHRMRDRLGEHGYFLTNTMGGEVVVNGQKIALGEVAGPMPALAVIQCPGGQVCFWWGENGRNWGDGGRAAQTSTGWEILRQRREWKDVGKSAGEVWDDRIIDRMRREEAGGEGEDDDEEWNSYRQYEDRGQGPINPAVRTTVGNLPPNLDYEVAAPDLPSGHWDSDTEPSKSASQPQLIHIPVQFKSPEDELRYISLENPLLEKAAEAVTNQPIIEPSVESFWTGPQPISDFVAQARVRNQDVNNQWKSEKEAIFKAQIKLSKSRKPLVDKEHASIFAREQEASQAAEGIKGKRKRGVNDDGGRPAKFRTIDPKVARQRSLQDDALLAIALKVKVARAAEQRQAMQKARELEIQVEELRRKDPNLSAIDAKTRVSVLKTQKVQDSKRDRLGASQNRKLVGNLGIQAQSDGSAVKAAEAQMLNFEYDNKVAGAETSRMKQIAKKRARTEKTGKVRSELARLERERLEKADNEAAATRASEENAILKVSRKDQDDENRKEGDLAKTAGKKEGKFENKDAHKKLVLKLCFDGYRGAELEEAINATQAGRPLKSPPKRQVGHSYDKDTPPSDLKLFIEWDKWTEQEHSEFVKEHKFNEETETRYMIWKSLHAQHTKPTSSEARKQSVANIQDSITARAEVVGMDDETFVRSLGFPSIQSYTNHVLANEDGSYLHQDIFKKRKSSSSSTMQGKSEEELAELEANEDMQTYCKHQASLGLAALAALSYKTQEEIAQERFGLSVHGYLKACVEKLELMKGTSKEQKHEGRGKERHYKSLRNDERYRAEYRQYQDDVRTYNKEETERLERNLDLINREFAMWEARYELTNRPKTEVWGEDEDLSCDV